MKARKHGTNTWATTKTVMKSGNVLAAVRGPRTKPLCPLRCRGAQWSYSGDTLNIDDVIQLPIPYMEWALSEGHLDITQR